MPDTSTTRRLALIKYLYKKGVDESSRPEPVGALAVLTFHDAVELFLQLASEHLDAGNKQPNFMDYWDLCEPKLPDSGLSQKESMRRLNKARVALKHNGTLPSKLDMESFRASTTSFFEENTPIVFKTTFDTISLLDLVENAGVRNDLVEAATHLAEGKTRDATGSAGIAFDRLLHDYESHVRTHRGRSPFFFGDDFWSMGNSGGPEADFMDNVRESIEALRSAMKVMSMGIDYRRYAQFRMLIPNLARMAAGNYHVSHFAHDKEPTATECQFCIDFVVDSALQLQQFEFAV